MGQKVHPTGMRLGIVKDHASIWFSKGPDYARQLHEDLRMREHIRRRLAQASVSRIEIRRPADIVRITIHTARPGIVIGKKGEDVDKLRRELFKIVGVPVYVDIAEIRKPELDAYLVAQNVAQQLERRVQFRRAMKRVMQNATKVGAQGIKVRVAGRLGGVDIARSETYHEGRVPLHTLRADVDYAATEAQTSYGILGIKVWIFKGEILGLPEETQEEQAAGDSQQDFAPKPRSNPRARSAEAEARRAPAGPQDSPGQPDRQDKP